MLCERVREQLGPYLNNELLVETCLPLNHHLERCAACAALLEAYQQLRAALQRAFNNDPVPTNLAAQIRQRLP